MPNYITNVVEFEGELSNIQKMFTEIMDDYYGSIDFRKLIPEPATMNINSGSSQTHAVNVYLSAINPQTEDFGIEKFSQTEFDKLLETIKPHFYDYQTISSNLTLEEANKISENYFENFGNPEEEKTIDRGDCLTYGKIVIDNILTYGAKDWYVWRLRNWGTKWNAMDCMPQDMDSTQMYFRTAWSAPHPVLEALALKYPDIVMHHKWADEDWGSNTGYTDYNEEGPCEPDDLPAPYYLEYGEESLRFSAEVMGLDLSDYYFRDDNPFHLPDTIDKVTKEMKQQMRETSFNFPDFVRVEEDSETDATKWTDEEKIQFIDSIFDAGLSYMDFLY